MEDKKEPIPVEEKKNCDASPVEEENSNLSLGSVIDASVNEATETIDEFIPKIDKKKKKRSGFTSQVSSEKKKRKEKRNARKKQRKNKK